MGQNWAIAIGINQYDNLQNLDYAKNDAESIQNFFEEEAGFQQVYLFTEDSPPIQGNRGPEIKSKPTYTSLKRFLRERFKIPFLTTGDNFWFFFAGHGIQHEGTDYLMPLDVDPGDIDDTAIPVSYVTERLQRCGADNVILLIDACRNWGQRDGQGVGTELQKGVITVFSCSPRERSYEIEQLKHGSFTYALLEGLRLQGAGNCATVERLDHYLYRQVPQLNHQYHKPHQTPRTTIEPITKRHLILLPKQTTLLDDVRNLKLDAFEAETVEDWFLADQLWTRVLAVSPADPQALAGIRRVARLSVEPSTPIPPVDRSSGRDVAETETLPTSPADSDAIEELSVEPSAPVTPVDTSSSRNITPTKTLPTFSDAIDRLFQIGRSFVEPSEPVTPVYTYSSGDVSQIKTLPTFSFEVVTVNVKGTIIERQQKSAYYDREDLGNGEHLDMVEIPAGEFIMGSPETEEDSSDKERPQHQVTVPSFFMGKYPITQAQWKAVVTQVPKIQRDLKPDPSGFKGDNRPVEQVSWYDAVEFCARLSKYMGKTYSLPSEAQWEYACRAGTTTHPSNPSQEGTTPFHFGETITTDLVNYNGNYIYGSAPKGQYLEETTSVGSFKVANAFGLYDMHGNVFEWCLDDWHNNYEGAPTDGSAWFDNNKDLAKKQSDSVLRGGSWYYVPNSCRSAYRVIYGPRGGFFNYVGFRVVCAR